MIEMLLFGFAFGIFFKMSSIDFTLFVVKFPPLPPPPSSLESAISENKSKATRQMAG